MIKVKQTLIFLFLLNFLPLTAQKIPNLLIEKKWSVYNNFAVIDFQENGKAILEYAYCSYCRSNNDTLDWSIQDKLLILGPDSLIIQNASKSIISTYQYRMEFNFVALNKIKKSKLKKEEIQAFLISNKDLNIAVITAKFGASEAKNIQFDVNGKMWFESPKFRGQWALKSFYGSLFLIYINRYAINRNFPLLKLESFKKNKLTGKAIPSVRKGTPFVLEITKKGK